MYGLFPASFRVATVAAAVALVGFQPVSSFAQTVPATASGSCNSPVLDLANPSPGDMLSPGAYVVQGTAVDPTAQQGSGIDQVSFFLGPRDEGGIALGQTLPTSGTRLDGFSFTLTLPSTSIGEHDFVAYAHSEITGRETEVSLPVVIGEDPSKADLTPVAASESSTNRGMAPSDCPGTPARSTSVSAPLPVIAPSAAAVSEEPACENCNGAGSAP